MAGRDPPSASKSGISLAQKIQSNQPPAQPQQVLAAINKAPFCRTRQRPGLAPAGDLLFLLVQAKKAKEHDPLPASLRCAPGKPASRNSGSGAAELATRHAAPLRQAAASQFTKQRCPAAALPAARTACRRRIHTGGNGQPARIAPKWASSPIIDYGSSYQI